MLNQLGQDLTNGAPQHRIGDIIKRRRLAVHNHHAGANSLGCGNRMGHRINRKAGSHGEQQVGSFHGMHGPLQHLRIAIGTPDQPQPTMVPCTSITRSGELPAR